TPMRYRLRPAGSLEEVPAKFNLYNARKDSLQERKSWKQLLGKSHGIFPFKSFFEWVKDAEGKSQLINFFPKEREVMWAPCLYDSWSGPKLVGNGKEHFSSFALITDGPAPEVAEQGHDRCPLFLKESQITQWLAPSASNPQDLVELLNQQEEVTYLHSYLEKTSNSGGENSQLKLF
ncbi:MAG: hypothetical protein HN509_00025, partial [Halobacteriovoraceae bacterium]|nr:hypothetical protein [Halobacteriovoraceae bacterium]